METADAIARRRILMDLDRTFFVEAAAGTGKTTALVGRILSLIRSGKATLDRIVAVTFTEKAAGEMKLRIRTEIEKFRRDAAVEERGRLDAALEALELAHIGTIHAFCGDLLHERPVEAGVDPLFDVAAEDETGSLQDEAFERWFQRTLLAPPEGVRRVLRRRSGWNPAREELRKAMRTLSEHRDFPHPWRRDPFDRDGTIDGLMEELKGLGELAGRSTRTNDRLVQHLKAVRLFVEETDRLEAVRGRDYDGLEAELRRVWRLRSWTYQGAPNNKFGNLSRDEVLALRDRAKLSLDGFIDAADADIAPLLHEELKAPIAEYESLKARTGQLDFLDLLIKARDLVRDQPPIRQELQARFSHFFVDEFQDTDPVQAELLLLLAASNPHESDWRQVRPKPGKLFLVGDPKQSIYRFRRADVAIYEDVKQRLISVGAELLHLTKSFRAVPSIQSFINRAFAPVMVAAPDGSQAAYVALDEARSERGEQPAIVALPVPRPYSDYGKIVNERVDESFADAVGAYVDWLVNESQWTIEEGGQSVPIRPRHVAILLRRFQNFRSDATRPYVRALEARRISHVLMGGSSFHDREEVIALRNALTAIEWPDDELRVFATLRGPFFAFSDETLLIFRQAVEPETSRYRRLNPMNRFERDSIPEEARSVLDALELLRSLHVGRNHRPIAETITALLAGVRAQAGIALWPTGEQALGNCQRVVDMARAFEGSASSFRAFVERLESDSETGDVGEAPIVEEGTEGVRLMTVHKAKGLEFPVVILADPTCPLVHKKPGRHVDTARKLWLESVCGSAPVELIEASEEELRREEAEAVRVAYVAATRAQDLLVLPVCGDAALDGWIETFNPVLYPPEDERRRAEPAPLCPSFGDDSLVDRGSQAQAPPTGPVKPGLHRLHDGALGVVWWDPNVLTLDVIEDTSLRYQQILEDDDEGTATTSQREYAGWKSARETGLEWASTPSVAVQTVTALARSVQMGMVDEQTAAPKPEVEILRIEDRDRQRPGGRRFGALVHGLLASVEIGDTADRISAAAEVQGRLIGANDAEKTAAITTVRRALATPLLRRASGAGAVRRESPVLVKRDDGTLLEGVVDLAFRDDDGTFAGWTVVDFKTDREFDAASDQYVEQVRLYCEAVAKATGLPTRGRLLLVV